MSPFASTPTPKMMRVLKPEVWRAVVLDLRTSLKRKMLRMKGVSSSVAAARMGVEKRARKMRRPLKRRVLDNMVDGYSQFCMRFQRKGRLVNQAWPQTLEVRVRLSWIWSRGVCCTSSSTGHARRLARVKAVINQGVDRFPVGIIP